jgi:hypothetical protein
VGDVDGRLGVKQVVSDAGRARLLINALAGRRIQLGTAGLLLEIVIAIIGGLAYLQTSLMRSIINAIDVDQFGFGSLKITHSQTIL